MVKSVTTSWLALVLGLLFAFSSPGVGFAGVLDDLGDGLRYEADKIGDDLDELGDDIRDALNQNVTKPEAIWCVDIMPGCGSVDDTDYKENAIFSSIIPNFITWIIRIAIAGGVVVAIIGGIMVMISAGDEEMRSKGNKAFYFAGIGITVSLFAYLIVELINRLPFPNV